MSRCLAPRIRKDWRGASCRSRCLWLTAAPSPALSPRRTLLKGDEAKQAHHYVCNTRRGPPVQGGAPAAAAPAASGGLDFGLGATATPAADEAAAGGLSGMGGDSTQTKAKQPKRSKPLIQEVKRKVRSSRTHPPRLCLAPALCGRRVVAPAAACHALAGRAPARRQVAHTVRTTAEKVVVGVELPDRSSAAGIELDLSADARTLVLACGDGKWPASRLRPHKIKIKITRARARQTTSRWSWHWARWWTRIALRRALTRRSAHSRSPCWRAPPPPPRSALQYSRTL